MACDVWGILHLSVYRRVATITTTCLLCSIPLNGFCFEEADSPESNRFAIKILTQIDSQNLDAVLEEFDKLEEVFDASSDPLAEGRNFLQTFINELNIKYNLNLTIQDACKLVRENLHTLNLPEELQRVLLTTINLYESDSRSSEVKKEEPANNLNQFHTASATIQWPSVYLLGLNKKKKRKPQYQDFPICQVHPLSDLKEGELPGNVYIGGCEVLAGALICVIGLIYPPAVIVGTALITDGGSRLFGGLVEIDDKRKNDPNYVPPPNPPGFNF